MSDGEQLLLVLSLIYLSGCVFWVDRRTVLFTSGWGRTWKSVAADYRWGNSSGRFFLLNPFLPLGMVFATRLMPVSVSPDAVVAYNAQTVGNTGRPPQSGRMASIAPGTAFTRKGSSLVVDGETFCDVGDVETAHRLVVLLNGIKGRDKSAREQAILQFWTERLDLRGVKERIRTVLAEDGPVRLVCTLVFLLFFVAIPVSSVWLGVNLAVLFGAVAMLSSAFLICAVYFRCHRRHYPVFQAGIWSDLIRMMLCPPTAIRAVDLVMCRLSAPLDMLPMARLLLRGAARESFLSAYLDDLRTAELPEGLSEVVRETCLWQNRMILRAGGAMARG